MKSNIKYIDSVKSVIATTVLTMTIIATTLLCIAMTCQPHTTNAKSKQQGLSTTKLGDFAQAGILYYNPGECISSNRKSSGMCGSTAEEKIWSILRQTYDPLHAAAAFGNIAHEGGFQPVKWEYGKVVDTTSCSFVVSWDDLYDGSITGVGVGSFAITSGLSKYLHYINDNAPDLLQYFKDPSNTCYSTGDDLAEKLGQDTVDALIEFEVDYFINHWIPEEKGESVANRFAEITDLREAAMYWAHDIEVCAACGYNWGDSQLYIRADAAEKYYEQYKDFTCSGSASKASSSSGSKAATAKATTDTISVANNSTNSDSTESKSSSSTVSGSDITWIGDSYSVGAQSIIEEKYPGISFGGSVNDSSSTIQGSKFVSSGDSSNPSCLTILQDIIDADNLKPHLVFACGTNGGWSDDDVSKFQEMIKGKNTKAVVVTSKIPKNDYAESNKRLKEMADSNDDVSLADWTTVYEESYFDSDPEKIHPTTEPGYEKWVGVISDALGDGGGCRTATYEGDYPQYNQCGDPRWSGKSYSTDNICGSGCGAASMAMLATVATGQDIFPNDIADLLGDQYYDSTSIGTLDPIVGDHYGFEVEVVNTSGVEDAKNKMRDYLKKGYMIHFTGRGCYPGFIYASGGCTSGHVIGLFDIDENDIVTQANSGMGEVHQKASLDDMANALNFNIFTAIKGSNSGGAICDTNICNDSGNKTTGTSGYKSAEDAKHIIDEYLDADMSGYSLLDPGTQNGVKDNCVAFSCWFITNYTEISYPGGMTGEGKEFVDVFYNAKKDEYPDLEISDTPTVYSVAQWSDSSILAGSSNHTGVVIGIDEASDTILIAEAGWANPCFTGIHGDGVGYGPVCDHPISTTKYSLSSATGGTSKYINLNKYLKSNTGLK